MKVLLVEDSPTDSHVARKVLTESSLITVDLVHVETLDAALRLLEDGSIDVVLLDLNLPDSTDFATFESIQAAAPDVPVVALTGRADEEIGHRLVHAGAQDFVIKGQFLKEGLVRSIRYAVERKRAELALQKEDRRRNEFLAMLAHELRNPLAPIASAVDVLRDTDSERTRRLAEDTIARQVRHMSRLIDDMLDLSRFLVRKIRIRKARASVQAIVESALEVVAPIVREKHHEVRVSLDRDPLYVQGNEGRLVQVVGNLLDNAARYTPEEGHIEVSAEVEGSMLVLRVRDDGPGMTESMLDDAFELFLQEDESLDRSDGGLGLGLTLARAIVEQHGGTLRAFNRPEGGAELLLRIPVGEPKEDAPGSQAPGSEASASLRLLVVEDNEDGADMLKRLLELRGHEVRTAGDGATALQRAEELRPQAVLVDIGLPDMDGYELARRLRETESTQGAVLIALTGYEKDRYPDQAEEAGFDHYLLKPADLGVLESLLGDVAGTGPSA